MNSKHTAGPWKFTSGGGNAGPQLLGGKNGLDFIMDMGVDYHRKGEMPIEADRLLIEAAPEMLDALELAVSALDPFTTGPCQPDILLAAEAQASIVELLKKAKGE